MKLAGDFYCRALSYARTHTVYPLLKWCFLILETGRGWFQLPSAVCWIFNSNEIWRASGFVCTRKHKTNKAHTHTTHAHTFHWRASGFVCTRKHKTNKAHTHTMHAHTFHWRASGFVCARKSKVGRRAWAHAHAHAHAHTHEHAHFFGGLVDSYARVSKITQNKAQSQVHA